MAEPRELVDEAARGVAGASTLEELSAVRTAVSGKRSPLVEARRALGAMAPEARREAGQALNEAKAAIDALLDAREPSWPPPPVLNNWPPNGWTSPRSPNRPPTAISM
ncbi:hypothetical protein [Candidatus Poriferisocius sp.]|uniref:hypothetical protein n=1 Tax=Candidatus Poriferisocius sp. TaxID=3101276 RepID=UPI003B59F9FB